jgi:hypothetical protein
MQELSDIMQKSGGIDPNLMEALFVEYANSTDMAQKTKDIINNIVKAKQEQANQPPGPPPQKPPNISYAFKGEDFANQWVQELTKEAGVLTPDAIQRLQQTPPPMPPGTGADMAAEAMAQEPQLNPLEIAKHRMEEERHTRDAELHAAKLEGYNLDNMKKTQEIADNEAMVNAGLSPSVAEPLESNPTAFSPQAPNMAETMTATITKPMNKRVSITRGDDGRIDGFDISEME